MAQDVQLREYTWWQWALGGLFIWPFMGMVLTWVVPETGRRLTLRWVWVGGIGLIVLVGAAGLVEFGGQDVSPRVVVVPTQEVRDSISKELNLRELILKEGLTVEEWRLALDRSTSEEVSLAFDEVAIEGLRPAESWLTEEWIRHENLNREWSSGIVVDESMSNELLDALYFYDQYLDAVPLAEVAPDDVGHWCLQAVLPMVHYSKADDQHKVPIIEESRERMEQDVLDCIADPRHSNPELVVWFYYEAYHPQYMEVRMSPYLMLALHRMDMMFIARDYQYTLTDITDECVDRNMGDTRAMMKCLAMRLITEVPAFQGYSYEHVRGLME